MQILPGVYLVDGFPYGEHQNSYVLKRDGAVVMIDSGESLVETFGMVRSNCARWAIELEEVSHLLITHAHFDHLSNAARLQEMGVKLVANADCADAMAAGDDRTVAYSLHRRFTPCIADIVVKDGDVLHMGSVGFRCIEAPGHARSCAIYQTVLDNQRVWFIGDVVMVGPECRSVELGWNGGPDYDRTAYLATLRTLAHMECDVLLPGHGHPCIGGAKRLLEDAYNKAMTEWR
jgi:metallo-beta-lactamase class B